jgi:hypothetical protein
MLFYCLAADSNGVLIHEFEPKKWYFLGIEHDKPFLSRPTLNAMVNEKQVVNRGMDYPRFDKSAKTTNAYVGKNFTGQVCTFAVFEEIINMKKLYQLFSSFGLGGLSTHQSLRLVTSSG